MGSLDFKAVTAKNNKLGFHNHTFVPVAPEGPMFCLWKATRIFRWRSFRLSLTVLTARDTLH